MGGKVKRSLTKSDYSAFYRKYIEENKSLKETAKELHVTAAESGRFAKNYGFIEKKQMWREKQKEKRYDWKRVKELYKKGFTLTKIAKILGYPECTFINAAAEKGYKRRRRICAKTGIENICLERHYLQEVIETVKKQYKKGDILEKDGCKYLVIDLYPYHLVAQRYLKGQLAFKESFQYIDFFAPGIEGRRKKEKRKTA